MNEEELAALAEKLYAQGLSDDEVAEHLRRAALQSGETETATSPVEAGAMQAIEGLSMGIFGRPGPGSGYQGGEGGRQMLSPEDRASREESAAEREMALAIAEQEHPTASKVGRYGTLALPGVGMGPRGAVALGRGAVAGGKALARGGKEVLGFAKDVLMFGPNKFRNAATTRQLNDLRLAKKLAAQPGVSAGQALPAEAAVAKALGVDPSKFTASVGSRAPSARQVMPAISDEALEVAAKAKAPTRLAAAKKAIGEQIQAVDPARVRAGLPGFTRSGNPQRHRVGVGQKTKNVGRTIQQLKGMGEDQLRQVATDLDAPAQLRALAAKELAAQGLAS